MIFTGIFKEGSIAWGHPRQRSDTQRTMSGYNSQEESDEYQIHAHGSQPINQEPQTMNPELGTRNPKLS